MPRAHAAGVVAFALLAAIGPAAGQETDANIVTGIDMSDSIGAASRRLQLEGLAAAIRDPQTLAAIRRGLRGRVGFMVFAWHRNQYVVVPWQVIGAPEDAEAVAALILTRLAVNPDAEERAHVSYFAGRPTDLSAAIDFAGDALDAAPFAAEREVVNIIGNGTDNVGREPDGSRDALLVRGVTVNGVVLDGDPEVLAHYGDSVVGGPGAFLLAADAPGHLGELMRRKFLMDLMAAADVERLPDGRAQPAAATIGPKSSALSEAPPTRAPSTFSSAKISAALPGFTEPP
jgi:hypothetical protein